MLAHLLSRCRKLAAAKASLTPTWNLRVPRHNVVPSVLAHFGRLSAGCSGGVGPVQLWRSTNVAFVDADGLEEEGSDHGGLTLEPMSNSVFGQLPVRRLLSAPEHASGCPKLRPASANQPLGPRWPAIQALLLTQARAAQPLLERSLPARARALRGVRGRLLLAARRRAA